MRSPCVYLPDSVTKGKSKVTISRNQLGDNLVVPYSVSQTLDNLRMYMGFGGYGSILTNNQIELVKA